jgi:aminobenzoyl-glutamate utilization protein B
MSIGEKGMIVAARTLAGATLELLANPETLERARSDFETRRTNGKIPQSVLPKGQTAPN